jgi:hypothetical protein
MTAAVRPPCGRTTPETAASDTLGSPWPHLAICSWSHAVFFYSDKVMFNSWNLLPSAFERISFSLSFGRVSREAEFHQQHPFQFQFASLCFESFFLPSGLLFLSLFLFLFLFHFFFQILFLFFVLHFFLPPSPFAFLFQYWREH